MLLLPAAMLGVATAATVSMARNAGDKGKVGVRGRGKGVLYCTMHGIRSGEV
jgi:hypothetical protein